MRYVRLLKELAQDAMGATAVEYGLVVAFIVIACMAAIHNLGEETASLWTKVEEKSAKAHSGV